MNKLKILIITNLYPPQVVGGYERQIADYARLLNKRGHNVLVLTSNTEDYTSNSTNTEFEPEIKRCFHLCGEWNQQGAEWFSFEQVATRTFVNRQILASELQSFQPDICLAGNIDFLRIELLEKILADDIPIVHFVMNSTPGYIPELAPNSILYKFITCSNWIREELKKQGFPTKTAETIHLGVPTEEFYQDKLPPKDKLRIVYASLIMNYKGADLLIESLMLLQAEGIEFTATFAGGTLIPEYVDELKKLVQTVGLEEQVKFTGVLSRTELQELYRTQNILVLPSRFDEPFSISLIEGMSAGLTIIASNTGGSPEAVEHGKSGLIFESENALDLADNLYYLVSHPDEWEIMAKKGQERALSKFSLNHTVDQLEDVLFQQVCKSKSRVIE